MSEPSNGRPTEAQLKSYSRYGQLPAGTGGVFVTSKPESPLMRVMLRYGHHKIWLQERRGGAAIQIEVGRTPADRWSTETTDWEQAVRQADDELRRKLIEDHIDGEVEQAAKIARLTGEGATIEKIRDNYHQLKFSKDALKPVSDKQYTNVMRVCDIVELYKTAGFRPSEMNPHEFVTWYVKLRTTTRIRFPNSWEGRLPCGPCSVRTAIADLKDFSSALSLAVKRDLLPRNPLARFNYSEFAEDGDDGAQEHREEASIERYIALMMPPIHPLTGEPLVDPETDHPHRAPVHECMASDGGARLRFVLASCFASGRRISDFLGSARGGQAHYPKIKDVLLTEQEIRAALRKAPNHREWWAPVFAEYGAIRLSRNKMNLHRIVPMGRVWREELDRWLAIHPARQNPEAPLVSSFSDPRKPLTYSRLRKQLVDAERIARGFCERMGLDPDAWVPDLKESRVHGFRSLWRTLMEELGWSFGAEEQRGVDHSSPNLNKHCLFYGGWVIGKQEVQAAVYARLNPHWLVAVANFTPAEEVVRKTAGDVHQRLDRILNVYVSEPVPTDTERSN